MKRNSLLIFVGIGAIMLVLGAAFGSVEFPLTKIQATTISETITLNHTTTFPEKTQYITMIYITTITTFTPEQGNTSTLTEWLLPVGYLVSEAYASGNCTMQAGTLNEVFTTTETSIQPENLTGDFSLTITTQWLPPNIVSEVANTTTVTWSLNCNITES